jgi:hypothetical protein
VTCMRRHFARRLTGHTGEPTLMGHRVLPRRPGIARRGREMTMPPIEYCGRTIEPQSYLSDGDQWHPKAILLTMKMDQYGRYRSLPTWISPSQPNMRQTFTRSR